MTDKLIITDDELEKLSTGINLCVCHIQSDCPTHPKGNFGVMTNLEIRKVCHNLITGGKGVWHELIKPYLCACGYNPSCDGGDCEGCMESHLLHSDNPDYLNNKSDAYDLIHFCINEWDEMKRIKFYNWMMGRLDAMNAAHTILTSFKELFEYLLKDQRALPTAVALYLKEKE